MPTPVLDPWGNPIPYDPGFDGPSILGITELTGAVTAGPGEGSQVATLADDAVTTGKIVDEAVTDAKIAENAIHSGHFFPLAVNAAALDFDAVTTAKILNGAVTNAKLEPEAVTADKIAPLAVGSSNLAASSVDGTKLTDLAVTGAKLALELIDADVAELIHANQVCAFTKPSEVKRFYNIAKIGTLGSDWTALTNGSAGLGNSGKGIISTGWVGGANQISTGATANSGCQLISCVNGLSLYGGAVMDDIVAATSKWHVEGVFRIDTAIDNQTTLGIGWFAPNGSKELWIGVRGASSTTKFRLYGGASGTNSTINIDTAAHRFRMWGNGDGKVYGSVDYETAIQLTGLTWGVAASPTAQVHTGTTAADRTITLGTVKYRVNGMVA